ncbi:MAG TPA: NADH:flavin oxidoreductase [Polyangia bacterium]|nr:NADH:flavin oxidoreductase [Polyangia bacterium]
MVKHALPAPGWPTADEAARARLFSPLALGAPPRGPKRVARARTWVPAMVPWRAAEDGAVTPALLEWYARFAAGRPGVLVVEATGIRDVPSGPLLRIGDDRFVPGLARLAQTIRDASGGETLVLIQLLDFLAIRRRPAPERYFGEFLALEPRHREALARLSNDDALAGAPEAVVRARLAALPPELQRQALSAREWEALAMGARERVTDTHLPHIRDLPRTLPELFARAALRARAAGFDGVELHYAHAYTMASFLSALNTRQDGYGGPPERRARLPLEVLAAARAAVGDDLVVGLRMLAEEGVAGGSSPADVAGFAVAFARAGADYLSLSAGGKFEDARQPAVGAAAYPYTGPSGAETMPTVRSDEPGPFGRHLPAAAAVRTALRAAGLETPVVAAGGLTTFALAEEALARGDADFVASARQSLADPDWFLKMRLGRGDEIRRCQLTNYCEALDQRHRPVTCQLWDHPKGEPRRLVAPPWGGRDRA